jgi:hypothetical protein
VETVNSMIKRRLGSALRARVEQNQFREITLRAITHNIMIVRIRVFYRAAQNTLESRIVFDDSGGRADYRGGWLRRSGMRGPERVGESLLRAIKGAP